MIDIITRFAPSPTGHLHIGGARTALFCWAFARGRGGRFLLRIEDTDQARSSESSTRGILEDLAWLGIEWDEGPRFEAAGRPFGGDPRAVGPFFQSERREIYDRHIEDLVERDLAYPAFETPEELEAARAAARAEKRTYRYDRAALRIERSERTRRMRAGEPHVIRLRMPDEPVVVTDTVLGEVTFGAEEADDFVLRKRDGFPTYHFAVVVDDELMGVTHVLRGQEHLMNTPKHVALQRALGFRTPVYAHMPLIFNPDGSKMSKRDKDKAAKAACREKGVDHPPVSDLGDDEFRAWLKDKSRQLDAQRLLAVAAAVGAELPEIDVDDFRRSGYLPEVVCNYIALLGWNPGGDVEKFDREFLAERFSLDRIGKTNSRFDRVKLKAFNGDAIAQMSDGEFAARWRAWLQRYDPGFPERFDGAHFALLARMARPRAKTFAEAREPVAFALADGTSIEFDEKAVQKVLRKGDPDGLSVLGGFRARLGSIEPFEPERIEETVRLYAEERGLGMGKVAQPLRVAVTGTPVSPPLGETLAVLGREEVERRIDRCIQACAG